MDSTLLVLNVLFGESLYAGEHKQMQALSEENKIRPRGKRHFHFPVQ
jgi:hypothetical protein